MTLPLSKSPVFLTEDVHRFRAITQRIAARRRAEQNVLSPPDGWPREQSLKSFEQLCGRICAIGTILIPIIAFLLWRR